MDECLRDIPEAKMLELAESGAPAWGNTALVLWPPASQPIKTDIGTDGFLLARNAGANNA